MDLGSKIKEARIAAGLSQRQLCAGVITRNMLSRIENGFARPSMDTLRHLAAGLGRPVSYFLEEENGSTPNYIFMEEARRAFRAGSWEVALEVLGAFREPDPVLGPEKTLLEIDLILSAAQNAYREQREPYCRELLDRAEALLDRCLYHQGDLTRRILLIRGGLRGEKLPEIAAKLPSLDEELLLRARAEADPQRAAQLLDAVQDRDGAWSLLRGKTYLQQKKYREAIACFRAAEETAPNDACRGLEICCRELGDYQGAYSYACKLRSLCE